jgi:transposase-like protein
LQIKCKNVKNYLKGGLKKMSHKIYDKKFKAKVALEALREEKTLRELSEQYGVNPNVISRWKKEVLEQLPEIFSKKRGKKIKESKQKEEELYKEIGKLKVENEFLKKLQSIVGILGMSFIAKLIELENKKISIRNQ